MADRPGTKSTADARWAGGAALAALVRATLCEAGIAPAELTPETLAPLDQFHVGGVAATLALARGVGFRSGDAVLDLGGGLGGPARVLARDFAADVTVVDITPAYARLGRWLTAQMGLADRVGFVVGDALSLPFPAAAFDVVWTQASGMNIADKEALYAEARRVLRPGGRLVVQELATGRRIPLRFPVTWADEQEQSYLRPPRVLRATIAEAGFHEWAWAEVTDEVLSAARAAPPCPSPLGVHLLLGPDAALKLQSLACNLAEGRLAVVQGVFERE